MNTKTETVFKKYVWYIPLIFCVGYFLVASYNFQLHDFANYYFSATAGIEFQDPSFIYSIYDFNAYAWLSGYEDVLIDFYINTPFTISAYHPFGLISNAYVSKLILNVLSCILFIIAVLYFTKSKLSGKNYNYFLLSLPVVFFVPIRNQILFGQSYFLIFFCIIFALYFLEKKEDMKSGILLVFVSLLKIFPIVYGIQFLLNKKIKALVISLLLGITLVFLSVWQASFEVWKTYLTDVLPTTLVNNSGVGFQFNAQSMTVFLKTLLVKDTYYNPDAIFDSYTLYTILIWSYKTIVFALFVQAIWNYRQNVFKVFVIITTCIFLLQDRVATYTQILWIIPIVYILRKDISLYKKYFLIFIILLMCNIPLKWIEELPLIFKFGRMWLMIGVAAIILKDFIKKINYKYFLYICCITAPICIVSITKNNPSKAEYVLSNKDYFVVFDYSIKNGFLTYNAIGLKGEVEEHTNIKVNSISEMDLKVIDNQIYFNGQQKTFDNSLKTKPKLVDNSEIYFLSDYNTRRGQFTLRKIAVE